MEQDPPALDSGEPSLFKRILHLFGLFRTPDTAEDLEHEIQELLEEGTEQGLISSREGQMINSILEFKDTLAHEIMTPQTEMICAPANAPLNEVIALITEQGLSRIPIFADSPDQIVGILHAKDLLTYCSGGITTPDTQPAAGELVKPAYFVAENYKIVDLLRDFQNQKSHMAIVTDEFGSVRGLVTLEDVLEEIVGEISDEYDKAESHWKAIDDHTLIADAKIDIEEIENFFGIEFPEGPYESVGGLILHHLGHLPESGAMVEVDGLTFRVISASKRRIKIVKVCRTGK